MSDLFSPAKKQIGSMALTAKDGWWVGCSNCKWTARATTQAHATEIVRRHNSEVHPVEIPIYEED